MRTVRALFEREADAKAARERLRSHGVPPQRMSILDRTRPGQAIADRTPAVGGGLWSSLKEMVVPTEEGAPALESRLAQGGFLLTASVPDQELEGTAAVLAKMGVVDFAEAGDDERGSPDDGGAMEAGTVAEARIPIVEEELRIGKTEREGASVRVEAFATERPVHERVALRGYRVRVDRRSVDRPLDADASRQAIEDLFSERSIELTETAEEVRFDKEARIREEVVVRREAIERVERIDTTLRSTDVRIDKAEAGAEHRPGR